MLVSILGLCLIFLFTACSSDSSDSSSADVSDESAETTIDASEETASNIIESLIGIGYTEDEAEAIETIFTNVGILDCDDMWVIMDNDPLKACALEYNDHQVNFTTEDNILFYVQVTGWKEEISGYGWYRSNWSGELKYGYYSETETYSVDLYSVDSDGSGGYYAVYNAEDDSTSPYKEE